MHEGSWRKTCDGRSDLCGNRHEKPAVPKSVAAHGNQGSRSSHETCHWTDPIENAGNFRVQQETKA